MSSVELHKIDFGDRLNLKSKLCQVIGLTKIIEGGMISEAKIVCENPEDDTLLFRFNLYGSKVLDKNKK